MSRIMTITEALVELKTLGSRIDKAMDKEWCAVKPKRTDVIGTKTTEEFIKDVKANYQSVTDLIEERNRIKSEIIKSNAVTIIKVGEKEMTVAEAIERKSSIEYDRQLYDSVKMSFLTANGQMEMASQKLEREIENFISKMTESGKDKISEEQKNFTESYRKMNEVEFIDPLGIEKVMEKLGESIEDFEKNVDVALSLSNATTFIEV